MRAGSGSLYCGLWLATYLSPQDCDTAVAEIAPSRHHAHFGVLDLTLAAIVAQLPDRLHDVRGTRQMRLRQQSAMGQDWQVAAKFDASAAHEVAGLAASANAQRFQLDQHHVGEAVIDLGKVEIGGPDLRHLERL